MDIGPIFFISYLHYSVDIKLSLCAFFFIGRGQYFSMQVVMNKCFLLNPEKNLAQIGLVVFEKNANNTHFNSEK